MDVLISKAEIEARVQQLADEIHRDFDRRPFTVVGVLTGSLVFLADLIRAIRLPHRIGLMQASSYRGTTLAGTLVVNDSLLTDVMNRDVLLLDDILDTGATLSRVVEHLVQNKGAATVKTAVLLRKIGRQTVPFEPDYVGFTIPNRFVVGYGLDFDDDYRHLPDIIVLPGPHDDE